MVLMCDVQPAIMAGTFRDSDPAPVLARMAKFLELARAAGVHVGHVAVRFEDGELSKGGWRRVRFLRWLTGAPRPRYSRVSESCEVLGAGCSVGRGDTQVTQRLRPRPSCFPVSRLLASC